MLFVIYCQFCSNGLENVHLGAHLVYFAQVLFTNSRFTGPPPFSVIPTCYAPKIFPTLLSLVVISFIDLLKTSLVIISSSCKYASLTPIKNILNTKPADSPTAGSLCPSLETAVPWTREHSIQSLWPWSPSWVARTNGLLRIPLHIERFLYTLLRRRSFEQDPQLHFLALSNLWALGSWQWSTLVKKIEKCGPT